MKNKRVRLFISAVAFLVFGWATPVYFSNWDYFGVAWWSAGIYGLPAVLLVVFYIDSFLNKLGWFSSKCGVLAVIDSLLAVALYYPGLMLVWLIVFVFEFA